MAQSIFFDVIARDKASSTFSRIGKASDSTHGRLTKLGKSAASLAGIVGVASFGAGAISFFKSSISEASDLNETVSKSRVIFGNHASEVERWAGRAAGAIGLSKQAALESAASFGDMFSQLGLGAERSTKMSKSVVQLAADLGSFNNLGTDDVLERIAGGFRGEYDALQKVIPNISAARVQQEALRQTHKKSVSDLTAAEKASATLAIIQHDGARAAGDFARTSGGLANQQKILKARTEDLQAAVGKGLLPVTTEIVSKTSEFVAGMQDGTGAGGDFVDVLKDAADVGKAALKILDAIPGPVLKFGAEALIAAVALRKLTAFTTGFGNSMAMPIARTKQMYAEMTYAETRMQRVTTASRALGGALRNVAGTAGMLALADGAKKSNTQVGYLETTLGGAAAGFATAGPVGAAVGALAGGFFSIAKEVKNTGKAAKDTIPTWHDYAGALNETTGATNRATREMVLQRLESTGLLAKTRELNIEDRTAIQATLGNEAARKKLTAALERATAAGKGYQALEIARKLGSETVAIQGSRVAQLQKNLALAATKEEAQRIQNKLDKLARTNATARVSLGGADTVISKLTAINQLMHEYTSKSGGIKDKSGGSLSGLLTPRVEGAGATGAIINRPTLALIGEAGPEALVPLNRTAGNSPLPTMSTVAGGGETIVEVHLHLDGETIVKQVRARNNRKGVRTANL